MGRRSKLGDDDDEFEEDDDGGGTGNTADGVEDDDDEDDELEDGQDEFEKDGFIVDDVEERRNASDGERPRKKKSRVSEKNFVLDEDDYELLRDNNMSGVGGQASGSKFKRLKVGGSKEGSSAGFRSAEEKLKRSLFGDDEVFLEDISEEEEKPGKGVAMGFMGGDDEMADFIVGDTDDCETGAVGRKSKFKESVQVPGVSSSSLQETHEVCAEGNSLGVNKLEDGFEPLLLSEKLMMEDDNKILETDAPERLQLLELITGPPPTDDKSIEEESAWIFNQLASGGMSPFVGEDQAKEIKKEEIGNVLSMLHVHKLDIPFIAMYRKELCSSLLKDPEVEMQGDEERTPRMRWHKVLWSIYSLDRKWLLLQKRKNALWKYYKRQFDEEDKRIYDETRLGLNKKIFESITQALDAANSEREVDDVDAKFNLFFPPGEADAEKGQFKRPKRKTLYSTCYKAGLWEVTNKFGLNAEQLPRILSSEPSITEELEDGNKTPEEVAANFTSVIFKTPQDVLKGARHMAAEVIGCEPAVKKHVRSIFMAKAVVSTIPTSEGNSTIDANHQLAGVKWLCNKPLSMFDDVQWLLIQKAEEEKLLEVTVKLPEDIQNQLLEDACDCFSSSYISKYVQLWNEQRKMIIHDSFLSIILPSMEKEARSLLAARAKKYLLMEYGKQLWNKVSIAPFQRKDAEINSEDEHESRVVACCWGPGKPATTMVMLDTAGEMIDVLSAGSLCVRSQGVAEQQRKKNDWQRVLKFLTAHQPHIICVGAANLSCRMLKDDLYEIIFKMLEECPRDVNQDDGTMTIVFGDETLSRIYENSQVSSDQLPGQPGIVKRAVALGRYLQNPLAMIATLCGPEMEIFSWKLCPLDYFLSPDEKYEMVEQVMVDATNQVGIDINLAASHEWLFAPLQFISGFGRRKACALQKAIVRAGSILNRKAVPTGKFIKKTLFINAIGFLRVRSTGAASSSNHIMDLLDDTRIHPESYGLAKNLAKDVATEDVSRDRNDIDDDTEEMVIEHLRERPDMLKALDIDEYAKTVFERAGIQKREILYDIKRELLHGFKDWRTPFIELDPEEEFRLLSGETDETILEGKMVQVTVRNVQESRIICTFGSGLTGFIMSEDYSDDGYDPQKIKEGDLLTCKIKNINKNRFLAYLTCKVDDLRRRPYHNCNWDPYYHEDVVKLHRKQDKVCKEKDFARKHIKPRMIVHPHFQNLTADEAIQYLSNKDAGESIIHPSLKGPSFLTLTLKIYDEVYAHKDIVEREKDHKDMTSLLCLGKTLTIDKETFQNLDEVIDRYVDPLVSRLKNILAHRKFRSGSKAELNELLRTEKAKNPMRIAYCFGISYEHPGTFILSYIRRTNPHHEYIGLYQNGFRFRRNDFDKIDHLVCYFQRNVNNPPDAATKSKASGGFSTGEFVGSDWGGSAGSNNDWGSQINSDRERSLRTGGRFGGYGDHPSGLPRPGRGRGRGRGRTNNESGPSDFGSGGWGFHQDGDDDMKEGASCDGASGWGASNNASGKGSGRCGSGGGDTRRGGRGSSGGGDTRRGGRGSSGGGCGRWRGDENAAGSREGGSGRVGGDQGGGWSTGCSGNGSGYSGRSVGRSWVVGNSGCGSEDWGVNLNEGGAKRASGGWDAGGNEGGAKRGLGAESEGGGNNGHGRGGWGVDLNGSGATGASGGWGAGGNEGGAKQGWGANNEGGGNTKAGAGGGWGAYDNEGGDNSGCANGGWVAEGSGGGGNTKHSGVGWGADGNENGGNTRHDSGGWGAHGNESGGNSKHGNGHWVADDNGGGGNSRHGGNTKHGSGGWAADGNGSGGNTKRGGGGWVADANKGSGNGRHASGGWGADSNMGDDSAKHGRLGSGRNDNAVGGNTGIGGWGTEDNQGGGSTNCTSGGMGADDKDGDNSGHGCEGWGGDAGGGDRGKSGSGGRGGDDNGGGGKRGSGGWGGDGNSAWSSGGWSAAGNDGGGCWGAGGSGGGTCNGGQHRDWGAEAEDGGGANSGCSSGGWGADANDGGGGHNSGRGRSWCKIGGYNGGHARRSWGAEADGGDDGNSNCGGGWCTDDNGGHASGRGRGWGAGSNRGRGGRNGRNGRGVWGAEDEGGSGGNSRRGSGGWGADDSGEGGGYNRGRGRGWGAGGRGGHNSGRGRGSWGAEVGDQGNGGSGSRGWGWQDAGGGGGNSKRGGGWGAEGSGGGGGHNGGCGRGSWGAEGGDKGNGGSGSGGWGWGHTGGGGGKSG